MSELDRIDKLYNSLSQPGQSYFYSLMSQCYNTDSAKALEYVLKRRDMAKKQGNLDDLSNHLSIRFQNINDTLSDDINNNTGLDANTQREVTNCFENDDIINSIGNDKLYRAMNERHNWMAGSPVPDVPDEGQAQEQEQSPDALEQAEKEAFGQEPPQPQPEQTQQNIPTDLQEAEQEAFGVPNGGDQQPQSNPQSAPSQQPTRPTQPTQQNPQQSAQQSAQNQSANPSQKQPTDPLLAAELRQGIGMETGQGHGPAPAINSHQPHPDAKKMYQHNHAGSKQHKGKKRDTYSPEDINMIKEGLGLYHSLDTSGQRYFNANLSKARRAPKELDKIKNAKPDQLKKREVGYDDYLKNIAYGEVPDRKYGGYHQISRPVPTKDKKAIDDYFAKSVGMPTDNFGMVLNGIKEFQDKQRQKKLHKTYIPKMSELQSAGMTATQGVHLFDSLSPEGQQYFKTNFYEAKKAPNRFQQMKVTPISDLTTDQRDAREKLRVTAQGEYFNHRGELVQGNDPVPDSERKSIDAYFKEPSTANAIAHGAVGSALLDYESNHVEQMRHPDKLTEAANRVSAKQGVNLYNSMTPEGQDYFLATLHQASNGPDKFYRVRQLSDDQLTNKQRESRDKLRYAASGIHFSKRLGRYIGSGKAIPKDDKAKIDQYFNQKTTMDAIKHDTLPMFIRKSQRDKAQQLFDKQQHPVKYLANDYKETDPARYNKMLEVGADLFDNLSPKGRKYLLQSSRVATFNLDDYNKALKADPATLTASQSRIKHSLDQAAGYMEAPNGKPVRTSPYALDRQEKSAVDEFLQDNVTQSGLAHGDTYDAIVLRNMKNRDLKETRDDERNNNPWVYYRHHLARKERREHPMIWAIGYSMGYAAGYNHELRKLARQQRRGERPLSKNPLLNAKEQMNIDRKGKRPMTRKQKSALLTPKQKSISQAFHKIQAHTNHTSGPRPNRGQDEGPSLG